MTEDEASHPPQDPKGSTVVAAPEEPTAGPSPAADQAHLRVDGAERPQFLLKFPADPELMRLVRAFEAGDYGAVRVGATKLAAATEDPAIRAAARELRGRIEPDPLMKFLLWVAIALFVFVVWYTYQGQSR